MKTLNLRCFAVALAATLLGCNTAIAQSSTVTLVRTEALKSLVVHPQRSIPATVVSLNNSAISAEIRGRVQSIAVLVGERVAAGDILAELDCRDYRLSLQQAQSDERRAQAALELAQKQLTRARTLVRERSVSEELVDQRSTELASAQEDLKQARIRVQRARLDVARCTLVAPFDGIVLERVGQVGELASPGSVMLRLLDGSRLEISAEVPVDGADALRRADAVWFENDTQRYPLTLRVLTPAVKTQARSVEARFNFRGDAALPGAAGRVVWRTARAHVPADLIVRRNGQLGVFVVRAGTARFVALPDAREGQPGATDLAPDTLLVTEGQYGLSDGARVDTQR